MIITPNDETSIHLFDCLVINVAIGHFSEPGNIGNALFHIQIAIIYPGTFVLLYDLLPVEYFFCIYHDSLRRDRSLVLLISKNHGLS